MRLKDLSMQWESLLDASGRPVQWSTYAPVYKNPPDPTSGMVLWSPGDIVSFWTPPGMPDGLGRAVKCSPSPFNKTLKGSAARPRAQMELSRDVIVDADAQAGGWPVEPADGLMGEERWFVGYFCVDPTFRFIATNPAPDRNLGVDVYAWHAQHDAPSNIGMPTLQVHLSPYPTRNDPVRLMAAVVAGRHSFIKPTTWPWDGQVVAKVGSGLAYVEIKRRYDISGPLDLGVWHKIVIHQNYDWRVGTGYVDIWLDGVKQLGVGGLNTMIEGSSARSAGDIAPWPADLDMLPSNLLDDQTGFLQQPRHQTCMYSFSEGSEEAKTQGWYDAALWDQYAWTKTIFHTGMGFYSQETDVAPTSPAVIGRSGKHERWGIFDVAAEQRLRFGEVEEDWPIIDNQRTYPKPVELHAGALRTLARHQPVQ